MERPGVKHDVAIIDLPYIEANRSRHGKTRYYFRVDGKRLARLPDDIDSAAFASAYWAQRRKLDSGEKDDAPVDDLKGRPRSGTFRALCVAYMTSDDFAQLDATTRAKRRAIIESMMLEPVKPGGARLFAGMPLELLDADNVQVLRDRKKSTPFAADERLKVLRQIFETTRATARGREKIVPLNVAKLVAPFRQKTEGHHTITDDELARFVAHHGADSKAVLAIVILMYTGLRVSDLALIGPQHRRGDKFQIRLFKGRNRTPTTLTIPVHPILDSVLARHPVAGLNYVMTDYGKPFTIKGLGNRVSDWFTQAGLAHCTAHSVRKGAATTLAVSYTHLTLPTTPYV